MQSGLIARSRKVTLTARLPAATRMGGPLLADCGVARRSLWINIAPSLLLALGQNRLRHAVQMWSNKGLYVAGLQIAWLNLGL